MKETRRAKIIVIYPDGTMYTGYPLSLDMNQRLESIYGTDIGGHCYSAPIMREWEIHARLADLKADTADNYRPPSFHSGTEFQCEWCGAVHPLAVRQCPQCGGWRAPV